MTTRLRSAAAYLAAPLACLAVWWRIPFFFFRDDDFTWLTLPKLTLGEALFSPFAQGTVRLISERLYFLTLTSLFGFRAWPFRVATLLTWFAALALIQWIGTRLTGSRAAGLLAALLWTIALPLATPLGWAAAYNQVFIAFIVLAAFAARLKGWRRTEAALYLAGFGVLEIIVMYPGLVLLHHLCTRSITFTPPTQNRESNRADLRDALWMLIPAALFTALHLFVIPKTESPIYQRIIDGRLPATLWTYIQWTVGPSQMQFRNPARVGQGLAVTWAVAAALAAFAVARLARRDLRPAFFIGWFLLWIAPVLPLPNHIYDYYVTLPGIGLAWLAGWALVSAWRSGWVARVPAIALAAAYAAGSIVVIDSVTKWYLDLTSRDRIVFRAMESAIEAHPGQTILLTGINEDIFLHTVAGGADRTLSIPQVWLAPGQDAVLDSGRLPNLQRFRVAPETLSKALGQHTVRVIEVDGTTARDITEAYGAVN